MDKILFISLIFLFVHGYGAGSTKYGNYILSFLFMGTIIISVIYIISRFLFTFLGFFMPFPLSFFKVFIPVFLASFFFLSFLIADFTIGNSINDFHKYNLHSKEFYYSAALNPISSSRKEKYRFYEFFMNKPLSKLILTETNEKIGEKNFNNLFFSFLLIFILVILSCLKVGVFKMIDTFVILNIFSLIIT